MGSVTGGSAALEQGASEDTFLLISIEQRTDKNNKNYMVLSLGARGGDVVQARWWDKGQHEIDCKAGCVVMVGFREDLYKGTRQLVVHRMEPTADARAEEFLSPPKVAPDEMLAELRGHVASMANADLRTLIDLFLDDKAIQRLFMMYPAAKRLHHARRSGLLEHVLGLVKVCKLLAPSYADVVDVDLLVTGAILHDIGKIYELSEMPGGDYKLDGQLIGHINLGFVLLGQKIREFDALGEGASARKFPRPLRLLLQHMILSHHGKLEFGSPKVPMTPEAVLLSALDDLEAKFDLMRTTFEQARQSNRRADEPTEWVRSMDRALFDTKRYLEMFPEIAAGSTTTSAATTTAAASTTIATSALSDAGGVAGEQATEAVDRERGTTA